MNNYTRIVGDVHGRFDDYRNLVASSACSIQVGDMGLGFSEGSDVEELRWARNNPSHKFIRGNHDGPSACWANPNYIGDYHADYTNGVFYLGGAWSIDYARRREGVSWWEDEELSHHQFDEATEAYLTLKPDVVISHDAPTSVPLKMKLLNPLWGGSVLTRTGYRLENMFYRHQPKHWFFGHWHKDAEMTIMGCNFRCLNELSFVDFDFQTLKEAPLNTDQAYLPFD